jgi:transposase-like protein
MARTVRTYTAAFKRRAMRELLRSTAKLHEVAETLNMPGSTLSTWRAQYKECGEAAFEETISRTAQVKALERENERLQATLEELRRDRAQYEHWLGRTLLENLRLRERRDDCNTLGQGR